MTLLQRTGTLYRQSDATRRVSKLHQHSSISQRRIPIKFLKTILEHQRDNPKK